MGRCCGSRVRVSSAVAPLGAGRDEMCRRVSELCTLADLKALLNEYILAKNLANARKQQLVNVGEDAALLGAVASKNEAAPALLKREDILVRIREHMQPWYEIHVPGRDAVRKCAAVFLCLL